MWNGVTMESNQPGSLQPLPHSHRDVLPTSQNPSVSQNPLTWSLFFSDSEDVSEFSSSVTEGLP